MPVTTKYDFIEERFYGNMRIGCVTRHHYPTGQEIRITKFAATLHSRGHAFFVFCPGDEMQVSSEPFEYGQIIRLRPRPEGLFGKLLCAPLPISPVWVWWFRKQIRKFAIDLLIVRDLRLALPVFLAASAYGIKTILDLGEHYPGMMAIVGKQNLSHYIIRNHRLIAWLEAISVRMADLVWVVVDENKERLKRYSSRIEVINNYPLFKYVSDDCRATQRSFSPTGEPVTLVSLGLIDNIRGLDLAIDAFAILERDLRNVRMVIYGDGFFRQALEAQVRALGLEDKVVFGGWVDEGRKYGILTEGNIGLLLHRVCDLTQHTVPNKLFDYMSVGLPVVSTRLGPVTRILEAEQCGIAVDETPEAVATGIKALILDVETRKCFAENGYRAVRDRYRWDGEEEKIIKAVNTLIT